VLLPLCAFLVGKDTQCGPVVLWPYSFHTTEGKALPVVDPDIKMSAVDADNHCRSHCWWGVVTETLPTRPAEEVRCDAEIPSPVSGS